MNTTIVQVTNNHFNWGKFLVGQLTDELHVPAAFPDGTSVPLSVSRGWDPHAHLVLDLETKEGAIFGLKGSAHADLEKHRIWVCPMFEPFLRWLYRSYVIYDAARPPLVTPWVNTLPASLNLPDAESALAGYRRAGHASSRESAPVLPITKREEP